MDLADKQSIADALSTAVEKQWSGILRGMVAEAQNGMIVLRNGRIAWAVSNNQSKDFPFFLKQIGRIPPQRLREIVKQQGLPGESKKIGPILEEAGLITHSTYRKCLLAHIRSAIASLLEIPSMVVQANRAEIATDDRLTFSLQDALGSDEVGAADVLAPARTSVAEEVDRVCNGEFLEKLALLSGYLYSFVANTSGELLAFHEAEYAEEEVETVFTTVADWITTSLETARILGMGWPQVAFMEAAGQSLLVQATDSQRQHFLAVAFNEEGKLGVAKAKAKVAGMIPKVQTFTDTR